MNAVISGDAGLAFIVDKGNWFSLHVDSIDELVPRRTSDYPWLLGGLRDLRFFEDVRLEDVKRRLQEEHHSSEALHLTLILLDGELPESTRAEAVEELSALLASEVVVRNLESVIHATTLPRDAARASALRLCGHPGTERVRVLLERLRQFQPQIGLVRRAWEEIPLMLFGSIEDRAYAQAELIRTGMFHDLVEMLVGGEDKREEARDFLYQGSLHRRSRPQIVSTREFLAKVLKCPAAKTLPKRRFQRVLVQWIKYLLRTKMRSRLSRGSKIDRSSVLKSEGPRLSKKGG